jgi:hypothetical protein
MFGLVVFRIGVVVREMSFKGNEQQVKTLQPHLEHEELKYINRFAEQNLKLKFYPCMLQIKNSSFH